MSYERLQDGHKKTLGFLDRGRDDRVTALNENRERVGYYDKASNKTYDAHGNVVGYGDLTASLMSR